MSDPIVITVAPRHIADGEKQNCHRCPVALATLEYDWCAYAGLPGRQVDVWADGAQIKIRLQKFEHTGLDRWITFQTPTLVAHFMDSVDIGESVEPFSFKLEQAEQRDL